MDLMKLLGQLLYRAFTEEAPRTPQRSARSTPKAPVKRKTQPKQAAHTEKVYGSEAIRPRTGRPPLTAVPAMIFQMRSIAPYDAALRPRSLAELFYVQARFMEHFTDDYPEEVVCTRTCPTYSVMSDRELRAYFTWRTRYRNGVTAPAQPAFLLLHAYELLNGIGGFDAAECSEKLCALLERYGDDAGHRNVGFRRQMVAWLRDYAACRGLPYTPKDEKEAARLTVLRHSVHSDGELLTALDLLSGYKLSKSKLTLAEPEQTAAALHAVHRAMLRYFAEEKLQSFAAHLLGGSRRNAHILFDGAVVDLSGFPADGEFRLSPLCVYRACGGTWSVERFCCDPDSAAIGAYLRTFDSILREETGFRGKLKTGDLPAEEQAVIRAAVRAFLKEKQAEAQQARASALTLNAEELAEIRAAAERTAEMLTLPEETVEAFVPQASPDPPAAPENTEAPEGAAESLPVQAFGLSAPALAMLLSLLTGQSLQPLRDSGQMLTLLAEEVNEKLYDRFGDIVLETADDTPALIPDYEEELRGLFQGP